MAHDLSKDEFEAFNRFLAPHGVQLKRHCTNPEHDHGSSGGEGEVY
jgi:hypothetical protein